GWQVYSVRRSAQRRSVWNVPAQCGWISGGAFGRRGPHGLVRGWKMGNQPVNFSAIAASAFADRNRGTAATYAFQHQSFKCTLASRWPNRRFRERAWASGEKFPPGYGRKGNAADARGNLGNDS